MTRKHLTALALVLSVFLIIGCTPRPVETACTADNLLLDISTFPSKAWEEIGSRDKSDAPSRLGLERAGTSFSTKTQGVAVQDYYRFATPDETLKYYQELQLDWFNLAPIDSVWTIPDEVINIQLRADKYRLGCSRDVIETCRFVAMYQTYVVEFKADMPSLSYSDFIYLLQVIDQKMMNCLEK